MLNGKRIDETRRKKGKVTYQDAKGPLQELVAPVDL